MSLQQLSQIFNEFGVHSFHDVEYKLIGEKRRELDAAIGSWFTSYRDDYVRQLRRLNGFNVGITWERKSRQNTIDISAENVFKKMLLLSNVGVILTPPSSP